MDFANIDVPKSTGTTSLAWDLISFMEEDFFSSNTSSNLKIWNGSAYPSVVLKRYNGSSWQTCSLKVYRGSDWI